MEIINKNNFEETIKEGIVVVDFFATWCGPCKMLSPILEEINEEGSVKVVKVDIDQDMELATKYGINAVPNLVLFKDGEAKDQIVGFTSKNEILKHINQL